MAKKDISISTALKRMKKLFPAAHVAVQYEASCFVHLRDDMYEKKVYVSLPKPTWSESCVSFEEAIQDIIQKVKEF